MLNIKFDINWDWYILILSRFILRSFTVELYFYLIKFKYFFGPIFIKSAGLVQILIESSQTYLNHELI